MAYLALISFFLFSLNARGACVSKVLGSLGKELQNVHGLAVSKKKIYWTSSKEYALYSSSHEGKNWRRLRFTRGRKPLNWAAEDLSLAGCKRRGNERCLYVANIGRDDKLSKAFQGDRLISFLIIPEDDVGSKVAWTEIRVRYPNKEHHHAEAFAVHPKTLDFYVITKKESIIYRLPYKKWRHRTPGDFKKRFVGELEKVQKLERKDITSLDFSSGGDKAAFISGKSLILMDGEFKKVLAKHNLKEEKDISSLEFSQQISIGFSNHRQFKSLECSK